jgi:hypothetical protein
MEAAVCKFANNEKVISPSHGAEQLVETEVFCSWQDTILPITRLRTLGHPFGECNFLVVYPEVGNKQDAKNSGLEQDAPYQKYLTGAWT